MKIKPIEIWKNGISKEAAWLNCHVISDNLKDSASFYYSLNSVDEEGKPVEVLSEGNLAMSGEDYEGWQTNEYAFEYVLNKLNLSEE